MDRNQIAEAFVDPPAAYRGKPFWSWNGELRGEELTVQHLTQKAGLEDEDPEERSQARR